jgi:tol-pal system protein YbgF
LRRVVGSVLLALSVTAVAADAPAVVEAQLRPLPSATLEGRLGDLSGRLDRLEDQASNQGLLRLLNQVEALKAEVARLRGAQEELAHRLQQADKRQKDVLADFDARIKELAELARRPAPTPAPAVVLRPETVLSVPPAAPVPTPPQPDPEEETRAYEASLNLFKSADHAGAANAFAAFLAKYPDSPLAGNAAYWQGLSLFAMADHKGAVAAQQRLLKDYPQHAKVPDAMVSLARAQIQLGETEAARHQLEAVIAKYPASRSAELAKKILSLFK